MDSLVAPTSQEMERIAQVQLGREQQEKRKSRDKEREHKRWSMEVPQPSPTLGSRSRPHRSSIFGRHKDESPPRNTSALAAAVASATAAGTGHDSDVILRYRAATIIQRTYRGYKTRREMKGLGLNANSRWTDALRELEFRAVTTPRARLDTVTSVPGDLEAYNGYTEAAKRSKSARYNWHKIATIARRAGGDVGDDHSSSSDSDSEPGPETFDKKGETGQKRKETRARRRNDATMMMGLQYFLEMVDLRHRYGSNLRQYHEEWKKADTHENFFYWLDHGDGRLVELSTCPRDRLEREQVRYLSREERQFYLVKVDSDGRLCWAKNGARIDTTEVWRDSIQGIVPIDDTETPAFQPKSTHPNQPRLFPSDPSSRASSFSTASESDREAARAAKYASPGVTDAKGVKKVTHISASTMFNTLLRKSVRKNTWIFVADTSFRLYVGIKDSGAFQHSSFVQGSRISAAGLIKIKNGRLASLSPLSGHYRPPTSNFRAFVRNLKDEGVDMSHVSISKSYAVLVGLEMYIKTRQKGKKLLQRTAHQKDKVIHPKEAQKREEDARDKSQSAETERRFLEKQQEGGDKQQEENRAAAKVMQKLKLTSTATDGQKSGTAGAKQKRGQAKEGAGIPAPTRAEESRPGVST
ncbi:IQ calmodulin-binding motif protein [Diaporthe helianthi]|uniref:IQ calmodulin-binding motif protein n=1 Tax=Diaporthe helianthi TaxID=158607 RepID=A0A2P5HUT9_DIAHE|nr:IQ calmodulin-binding motif protein [Diaporthe helianthi]